mmetsp:Transcript_95564/g.184350  ORF Transcript_95564/g.184350 Transcript_95564/m.184350 type:complete len:746 (+) Transcript_95564:79-2316(+)
MQVTVDASNGVPEGHVVSIRVGDVRRQAPLKKLKNHALSFPCALDTAAEEPMKIEVFSPEAADLVVLRPGSASYKVPLSSVSSNLASGPTSTTEPVVGKPMTLDIHFGKVGSLPPRSESRLGSSGTGGQCADASTSTETYEAAVTSARQYLETHKLLQYMQGMLKAVVEKQPEDPFSYMMTRMQMDRGDISVTTIPPLDGTLVSQMTDIEAGSSNLQSSSQQLQVVDDPDDRHRMNKTNDTDIGAPDSLENDKVLPNHKFGENVSLPCPKVSEHGTTSQSPSAVASPAEEPGGIEQRNAVFDSLLSCPAAAQHSTTCQVTVANESKSLGIDEISSRPAPTQPTPGSQDSEIFIQANPPEKVGAASRGFDSRKANIEEDTDGTFDELRLLCKQKLCDSFKNGQLKTILQHLFQADGAAADTDVDVCAPPAPSQIAAPSPPTGEPAMLQQLHQQQQQQQQRQQRHRPMQEEVAVAVERLKTAMGRRTCVCILGGEITDANTEAIVAALARKLGELCDDNVAFVSNGLRGVQTVFAQNLGSGATRLWHLAHSSSEIELPKVGDVIRAGDTFEQQKKILASLGEVYVTVAGGQGVANEARIAHANRALIVPLARTGGASAGGSVFPIEALVRPLWAPEDDWKLLSDTSANVDVYADVVARIVLAGVSEACRHVQTKPAGKAVARPHHSAYDNDAAWEARDKELDAIQETMRDIHQENRDLRDHVAILERRLVAFHAESTGSLVTQPSTQ